MSSWSFVQKEAEALTRPILDALGDGYSICCQGRLCSQYWMLLVITIRHMMTPWAHLWTHPQGTRRLELTNPRVMSVDLHTTLDESLFFPKPYGIRRIAHQALYASLQSNILAMWDLPHMWRISNIKYQGLMGNFYCSLAQIYNWSVNNFCQKVLS